MKTRTLLLLALGCGLAIMLAGAVFLFQLSTQEALADPVPLGELTRVGDMSVTVDSAVEQNGLLDITVVIGGVVDSDGATGFRLIASGRPLSAQPFGESAGICAATSAAQQTCHVRFDVSSADGSSRVLFYERGDQQARWVLG
jgi:hypothetical protein